MTLEIVKVSSVQEKNQFIRLPWKIYKDFPLWVPPLISERRQFLDPEKNPFFKNAEVSLYLVISGQKEPLGRIAVIDNRLHNEFHSDSAGFFGMFECVQDQDVADLLLDTAFDWLKSKGFNKLLGPMNLSTNHECGLLVEGFDKPPVMGIPYNPPYYSELFAAWGLKKAKDLLSLLIEITEIPEYIKKATAKILKRGRFTLRQLDMGNFDNELKIFWDVYNSAWESNWGFVPLSREEFMFIAQDLKHIIQPELCKIAEVKGEPVAFSLIVPDINQSLKKMNGRLFPFGFIKFFLNKNKIDVYRVMTLGVKNEFKNRGIDALLYYEIYKSFLKKNIRYCDVSWVLEDNLPMLKPMLRLGARPYKRHRIYERVREN